MLYHKLLLGKTLIQHFLSCAERSQISSAAACTQPLLNHPAVYICSHSFSARTERVCDPIKCVFGLNIHIHVLIFQVLIGLLKFTVADLSDISEC
jgi:hypothetical protein